MAHPYAQVAEVRALAGNPKPAGVSDLEIQADIESIDTYIDNATGRLGNQWSSSESRWAMITDISEHLSAANTIERFNTYGNIETSYQKAKFFRDQYGNYKNPQTGQTGMLYDLIKNLPAAEVSQIEADTVINVSHYETQDARIHDGETEITVYRSTEDNLGAAISGAGIIEQTDLTKKIAGERSIANMLAGLEADRYY
jgi:hypothetical protein